MKATEKIIEILQDAKYALFKARNEVEWSDIERSDIDNAMRSVESIIRNISAGIKRDA